MNNFDNLIKRIEEKDISVRYDLENLIENKSKSKEFENLYEKIIERVSGNGVIQNIIGEIYENSFNNYEEALKFYKASFEENSNFVAALNIARWYERGIFFKENFKKAFDLYSLVAQTGNSNACYRLGYFYEMGKNVPIDLKKAIFFYQKATLSNNRDAYFNLGMIYMKQKQEKLAIIAFEKAIELNNHDALWALGSYYEKNLDYEKAFSLYSQGEKVLNGTCIFFLGILYEHGKGVQKNLIKAREYYSKAVEFGNDNARKYLMSLGEYTKDDINFLETKANSGDMGAKQILAKYFYDKKDYEKAKSYALETSFFGSLQSIHILGLIELNSKNYMQAINFFQKAVESKFIPSMISQAWTYYLIKDYTNSEKIYLEVLSLTNREIPSILKILGDICCSKKQYEKAENFYKKIPNYLEDYKILKSLGYIKFLKEEYQEAIELYLSLKDIKVGDYGIIATCFYKIEDYENALKYTTIGLNIDSGNKQLKSISLNIERELKKLKENSMTNDDILLNNIIENIIEDKDNIEPKYSLITEELNETSIYKDVKFCALGGGNEIGASSYFIEVDNKKFIIDSGFRIKENSNNEYFPKFISLIENNLLEDQNNLEMILLSHGHLDHVGSLVAAFERFKNTPIFASGVTKDLAYFLLNEVNFTEKSEFFDDNLSLKKYEQLALEKVISSISTKNINEEIIGDGYKIKFFEAGHILGARMILMDFNGYKILFTGDFSEFTQKTVSEYKLPENLKVDLLITESTSFNNNEIDNREENIEKLIKSINSTLEFGDGSILIPAFSIGRAQEIARILGDAIKNGKITKNIPVYIDGTAKVVSKIYEKHGVKIYDEIVKEAELSHVHKFYQEQSIIISSSGMLLNGCKASRYVEKILPGVKNSIIFTGYLSPKSIGRRLISAYDDNLETFSINNKKVPLNAKVELISLGAHATQKGIEELIDKVEPRKVLLIHNNANFLEENNLFDKLRKKYDEKNIEINLSYNKLVTFL